MVLYRWNKNKIISMIHVIAECCMYVVYIIFTTFKFKFKWSKSGLLSLRVRNYATLTYKKCNPYAFITYLMFINAWTEENEINDPLILPFILNVY